MTRVLSELLGATEPFFSQSIRKLERMSAHPGVDIRITSDIQAGMRRVLHDLGLDHVDTTGRELYAALGERIKRDEAHLVTVLGEQNPGATDHISSLMQTLRAVVADVPAYAMKPTVARSLLKAQPPKKTMKALGYRSLDSMLKHEPVASLYAAARCVESAAWWSRLHARYAKLQATDFEARRVGLEYPSSGRWHAFATHVPAGGHVVGCRELGAVVVLPQTAGRQRFATLVAAVLALHGINDVRSSGTYLKLHQLRSGFGTVVQQVIQGDPQLAAEPLDQPVAWKQVHQFFARSAASFHADIFEPVVSAGELGWTHIEHTLAEIAPALEFWKQSGHLALLPGISGATGHSRQRPVSCNLLDSLFSHAAGLSYEARLSHYFHDALAGELLLRYLGHEPLEQAFFAGVRGRLAPEMAVS